MRSFHRLRLLKEAPKEARKLYYLSFALLGVMRLCIILLPFKYLSKYLGCSGVSDDSEPSVQNKIRAFRISYAVNLMSKHTPWKSECLARAMASQVLLSHYHISNTIYFGIKKDQNGKIMAHSWLKCGGYYITGKEDEIGYAEVARFGKTYTSAE